MKNRKRKNEHDGIIREQVNGVYPSDHFPVAIKMTMQNRKEKI